MKLSYRMGLYLLGGGALITWFNPTQGFLVFVLVIAVIIGSAYLDAYLRQARRAGLDPKIVSLREWRSQHGRRAATPAGGRERRALRTVYTTALHADVEALLHMLRAEGMNPMMVSGPPDREQGDTLYQVRLPSQEVEPAKPLIRLFQMKYAKTPF